MNPQPSPTTAYLQLSLLVPFSHHTSDHMSQWCLFIFLTKTKTKKMLKQFKYDHLGSKMPYQDDSDPKQLKKKNHQVILKLSNKIKMLQRCLHGINNMAKDHTISYQREKTKVHCNKRKTAKCWGKYIYLFHLSCFRTIKYRPLSYHSRLCPNVACKNTKKIDIS